MEDERKEAERRSEDEERRGEEKNKKMGNEDEAEIRQN